MDTTSASRTVPSVATNGVAVTIGVPISRLDDLRKLAVSEPEHAREDAWAWVTALGLATRRDREGALAQLGALFAAGGAPSGLDGATEGQLVTGAVRPVPDRILAAVTVLWLPWVGKQFDESTARGVNLLTGSASAVGRLVWPSYRFGTVGSHTSGFAFTTWVEKGKQDRDTDVLVIDYDSVEENPRLGIRSIRDELVELVPGANLGKVLLRRGKGDAETYSLVAYFALKSELPAAR
jgi:hypothetical protein